MTAAANRPTDTDITASTAIVYQALRDLGVNPVASAPSSPGASVVSVVSLAAQALRAVGVNLIAQSDVGAGTGVTRTPDYMAQNALKRLGVNLVEQATAPAVDAATMTLAQIATLVLEHLGVIASDETPLTADLTVAQSEVVSFHNYCASMNIVHWIETAVPVAAVMHYVIGTAAMLGPVFGKPADAQSYSGAVAGIKAIALSNAYAQVFAVDHINMIHDDLVARNLVTWNLAVTPDAAAEWYSLLAAQQMATAFGQQFDPAAYNGAKSALKHMAFSGAYGQTIAQGKITDVHEMLNAHNLAAWAITAIPTAVADAYIALAAVQLAPMVGVPVDPNATVNAIASVRSVVLSGAYAVTIGQSAITNIHDALVDSGLATWTINTIPASVADNYATLLEAQLAPTWGKAIGPGEAQDARDRITKIVLLRSSQALAEQILREWHSEWRARGMTRWELLDIPREAEESYIAATGYRLAPQFPDAHSPPDACIRAEDTLYRITSLQSTGEPVAVDCF